MLRGSRLVALVAAACCCTVSDALLLGPHPPCHRHVAAASTAGRARTLRCEEASPQEVEAVKNIPPEMLAAAWEREEEAKELSALLKGCQVYLVGLSTRKIAVGRALARRLQTYRLLDAPALMLSTYKALQGGEATEQLSMEVLMASEPVEDVQQLSAAVMREVQQYKRSVIVTWDGAVEPMDFMVMQQGIVANLQFEGVDDDVYLPAEGGEEILERWKAGHSQADVSIVVAAGVAPDDAAAQLVSQLAAFIKKNPSRSEEWKEEADSKLAAKEEDEE